MLRGTAARGVRGRCRRCGCAPPWSGRLLAPSLGSSSEMRSVCMILLLAAGVADAKKNKDADRHLEQALMKESASYIDEAIEMGAVSRARGRCLTVERLAAEGVLCCCAGYQQEGPRWTDTAHGRCSAGQDQERGGASEAQPRRDAGRKGRLYVIAVYLWLWCCSSHVAA